MNLWISNTYISYTSHFFKTIWVVWGRFPITLTLFNPLTVSLSEMPMSKVSLHLHAAKFTTWKSQGPWGQKYLRVAVKSRIVNPCWILTSRFSNHCLVLEQWESEGWPTSQESVTGQGWQHSLRGRGQKVLWDIKFWCCLFLFGDHHVLDCQYYAGFIKKWKQRIVC